MHAGGSFVIAAYHADGEGRLAPEIPSRGPCGVWDDKVCRLSSDHDRERKTGPCFPIRVMRCRVHRHAFTLYPPGHIPYGRKRLSPTACDGQPERTDDSGGAESFRATYFEAALDARQGKAWPQAGWEGSRRERFPTQKRQLRRALRLLGAAPELGDKERERTAVVLGVPGQTLHDAARLLDGGAGYRKLGRAACLVLEALPLDAGLFERLAESGFLAGFWPPPRLCPGPGRVLRRTPFRSPGTRPPPRRR